jgi:hypothetical protein
MRSALFAIVMVGLVGCGAQVRSTFETVASSGPIGTLAASIAPGPGSFDVALVQSNFTAECQDPIVVDDLFCQQVKISEMTGQGTTLIVPTGLNHLATDRAAAICDQLAVAHYDGDTSADLGYTSIEVLDLDGGTVAACVTR